MNRTLGLDFGVNASDRSTAAWMSGVIFVTLTIWTVFLDEAGKYVLYTLPFTLGTIYLYFKNGVIRWNRAGVQSLFLYVSIALISMVLNSSFNFQALREVAIVAGYLLLLTLWFRAPASTADYCLGVLAVGMVVEAMKEGFGKSVDLFGSDGILESPLAFPIGLILLYYYQTGQRGRSILAAILLFLAFKRITFLGVALAVAFDMVVFSRVWPRNAARLTALLLVLALSTIALLSAQIFEVTATWLDLQATSANSISLGRYDVAKRLWSGLDSRSFVQGLIGAGPGAADAAVTEIFAPLMNTHNDWLKLFYDYGIVGFVIVHVVMFRTLTENRLGTLLYIYGATLMVTDNIFIYMFYHPFVMLMLSAARRARPPLPANQA